MRRTVLAACLAASGATTASTCIARADATAVNRPHIHRQSETEPPAPAPFLLPSLSHAAQDIQLDWFLGRLAVSPGHARTSAIASLVRPAYETWIIVPRRVFVGGSFPIGFALPPDGGLAEGEAARAAGVRRFTGNLEGHMRAVFWLPTWLEIGFVLGANIPTSVFERDYRPNRSATDAVGALDPTEYVGFLPGRFALRPAGDLRIRRGPLVFQGRHGLDILIDNQGIEKATVAGRLMAHLGYVHSPSIEVSLEASQLYFLGSDDQVTTGTTPQRAFAETYRIHDGRRSAITFGPAVRGSTPELDYGIAMVTNLSSPLSPVADGFVGFRFSVIAHVPR